MRDLQPAHLNWSTLLLLDCPVKRSRSFIRNITEETPDAFIHKKPVTEGICLSQRSSLCLTKYSVIYYNGRVFYF